MIVFRSLEKKKGVLLTKDSLQRLGEEKGVLLTNDSLQTLGGREILPDSLKLPELSPDMTYDQTVQVCRQR